MSSSLERAKDIILKVVLMASIYFIYVRSLGSQKPGKAQQGNSYIATRTLRLSQTIRDIQ